VTKMRAAPLCVLNVFMLCTFAQTPPAATPATPTFRVGATNVLVDVVVTDRHGVPVEGLTQDKFSVLEDGQPQTIVSFAEHSPSINLPAPAVLPSGVYRNTPPAPDSSAADVLLIDALNTPNEGQVQSHRALLSFLKTLPPNKPVAIFTLDTQLHQLEDFTTDHNLLLRAVEEFTARPNTSPLLKTPQQTEQQRKDEDDRLELGLLIKKPGLGVQMMKNLQQFNANQDSFTISLRVQYTLSAFDQLARYLTGMPGRKNLLWLSGSFPLAILPDSHLKQPTDPYRDFSTAVDHTANLLANARVAIYPIDARGLYPQSLQSPSIGGGTMLRTPDRVEQEESSEFSQHAEEQISLEKVAHATGGEAVHNTNDLGKALTEVDRDGAYYYTLAYNPSQRKKNDGLRSIAVQVEPGKYHLAYRHSYAPEKPLPIDRSIKNFGMLMQHNVPSSTQITFRLSPVKMASQPATSPIAGSNPKTPRPVVRYAIDYAVDVLPIALTPAPDGSLHGSATVVAIAYNHDGQALNSVSNTLQIAVPAAQYSLFVKEGIHYREQLDVPAKASWLRVGVFDPSSGRNGSLEIPLSVSPGQPAP
jgi:VWFA-related protein